MVRKRPIAPEQYSEVVRLYKEGGYSQRAIASEFGVSQTLICYILFEMGVEARVRGLSGQTKAQVKRKHDRIKQLYLDGVKIDDICERLDVSPGCIQNVIYRSDFTYRRKKPK
jgi:transposase